MAHRQRCRPRLRGGGPPLLTIAYGTAQLRAPRPRSAINIGRLEALAFYGRIFDFQLRGKSRTMAFIDLGDQFIALHAGRKQPADDSRHVGLVVDDKEAARTALKAAGSSRSAVRFSISATPGAIASRL